MMVRHRSWAYPKMSFGPWPSNAGVLFVEMIHADGGWRMPSLSLSHLSWSYVASFEEWYVTPTEARSPLHCFVQSKTRSEARVPFICSLGQGERPILQHVAENGFFDVTESVLKLLLKEEFGSDVASEEETLLGELLLAATEKALKCGPEKAVEIMEKSLHHREEENGEVLDLLKLPAFQEVLTKEDKAEVEADISAAAAKEQKTLSIAATIRRVRGARKKSKKKDKKVKRKPVSFSSSGKWTVEGMQTLLPSGNLYRAYKDQFNKCWRVFGKNGWSMSRSWGRSGEDAGPIRTLLIGTWDRHIMLNPDETCPWEFADLK